MGELEEMKDRKDAGPPSLGVHELIEGLEDGVILTDGRNRVTGANPALGRMLGLSREGLLGRRTADFFCDTEGRPLRGLCSSDAARLRDARGALVPVVLRELAPGIYLVADRSRESRLEGEVWRLSQQLLRRAGEGRLPDLIQGEVPAMIEHEIRTASTAVQGYLRMLLAGEGRELTKAQRGFAEEALRAAASVESLLDNLLEVSSPDAPHGLCVVRKSERLHPVVEAAVTVVRPLVEERSVKLELQLDADDDAVLADATRLEQVIVNLLTNALKFGPEGGTVAVSTSHLELEEGPWLCLSVRDQGPGVPASEAEIIFQPFVRGRLGQEAGSRGVGLGLAIGRKLVEAHEGTIEAVPSLGYGLFRVLLPSGVRGES